MPHGVRECSVPLKLRVYGNFYTLIDGTRRKWIGRWACEHDLKWDRCDGLVVEYLYYDNGTTDEKWPATVYEVDW